MTSPDHLDLPDGRTIAYHRTEASGEGAEAPPVVFLGGFVSDMTGTKATFLEGWARERGRAFLRFDYTGHGASSGAFEEGCVGDWARDAEETIAELLGRPAILVGSSMGGWIALLIARRAPERVAALVGVAAAPDFTEDRMWREMDADARAALKRDGRVELPNAYGPDPYVVTEKLIEDGRENLVLRRPLHLPFPVRLLQGSADLDVPQSVALSLFDHIDSADMTLKLVKGADHRFSGPRELALIADTLDDLGRTPEA